jgi:UDP-2,3-diacylglucosamine hydrolase
MIYFASDFHLGIPDREGSLVRERMLISWLEQVSIDAEAIYLMGDLFDFWFEYKTVVPKGYTRLLGKLAEITDSGIEVHLYRGNHDLWAFDYLETEVGVKLHRQGEVKMLGGKKFFLSHGDGLGPGDNGYKLLKSVFENKINQFLYRWIHPDLGTRLGSYFSTRSRLTKLLKEGVELRSSNHKARERLLTFSHDAISKDPKIDFLIFGHVHFPEIIPLNDKSLCVVLGDWVRHFTYACYDGSTVELRKIEANPT